MLITCPAVNGCQEPRRVGAHLTALTQPHGVRNRCFGYRSPEKGLDDRRNRGRRQFGHACVFEAGEYRVSPPAERGRCQQLSQQQTSPANKRQDLQSQPPAAKVARSEPERGDELHDHSSFARAYLRRLKLSRAREGYDRPRASLH
jgi:hypothetical protein